VPAQIAEQEITILAGLLSWNGKNALLGIEEYAGPTDSGPAYDVQHRPTNTDARLSIGCDHRLRTGLRFYVIGSSVRIAWCLSYDM
jgi:hypothetical protein